MSLLKKVFICALFLFPLGEILRIDFANGVTVKPLDIGVGILISPWLIFRFSKKQKIKQVGILVFALLFAASGLFSLIINSVNLSGEKFLISFLYLLRWIAYAGIFFVVSDFDGEFKRRVSKLLIIVGSLTVGFGYVQYLFYPNLRNLYYLGWDEHMYRMFSIFLDPNFAGAFFVLFFLFLINLFFRNKNIAIGILAILTLGAIFLTFSRSALIMLIVSSSLLFILLNKKKLILILLILIFSIIIFTSQYFKIENMNLFRVVSSEARVTIAKEAIKIFQKHPAFGVGFNAYRYAKVSNDLSHADAGTDNSFLFLLATTGIIGFILYLLLWFRIFKIASPLAIASIAGVFVDSMFINSLFYSFIMFWLWIISGIKENT